MKMLCASCQIVFPFYLRYCRQCGEKLVSQPRANADTLTLASTSKRAETGEASYDVKYNTAPITMAMGEGNLTIADMLQNVMASFPSVDTARMSEYLAAIALPRRLSMTERMKDTLREFSMEELSELEQGNTTPLKVIAESFLASTAEMPLQFVAATTPLETRPARAGKNQPASGQIRTANLKSSARIHMRPSNSQPIAPAARPRTIVRRSFARQFLATARHLLDLAVIRWYNFICPNNNLSARRSN
jgi:hypothetical protein